MPGRASVRDEIVQLPVNRTNFAASLVHLLVPGIEPAHGISEGDLSIQGCVQKSEICFFEVGEAVLDGVHSSEFVGRQRLIAIRTTHELAHDNPAI